MGPQSFSNKKPKNDTVTIAQTASTVLNINAVRIKATAGASGEMKKNNVDAVIFVLNLAQPLNASFDIIVNSAVVWVYRGI